MENFDQIIQRVRLLGQHQAGKPKAKQNPIDNKEECNLPLWPSTVRPIPNVFLRSALFGVIAKGRRRFVNNEQIAAVEGIEINYTGEHLDQGDLDVWCSVLHAVRLQELGGQCRLTSYSLLQLMGKTDTGKNRAILNARITRLRANAVEVKQGRNTYIGSLIDEAFKDEVTQEWVIVLNPKLHALYGIDQFTHVDWALRNALAGRPQAQWLLGFYASNAKPFPMRMETLLKLSGSENENPRSAKQKLRKALDDLAEASAEHGEKFSYAVNDDLVHVKKSGSRSQQRHLAKKITTSRKPRG